MVIMMYDAYIHKMKAKRAYDNQLAWLSGLYVQSAVGSLIGDEDYMKPIDFEKAEKEQERLSSMTDSERVKEESKKYEENSRIKFMMIQKQLAEKKLQD